MVKIEVMSDVIHFMLLGGGWGGGVVEGIMKSAL